MTKGTTLGQRLEILLEAEFEALTAGRINEIEQLAEQKVALLELMTQDPVENVDALKGSRDALLRNQILSLSAIDGMRLAIARAKEIEKVSAGLRTYGANGQESKRSMSVGRVLSKRS